MRSRKWGAIALGILIVLFVSFDVGEADVPTQLIVVTGLDNSLWKMTCNSTISVMVCTGWSKITGAFAAQPTLIWDPALGRYFLYGVGLDGGIWRSTFDILGNHDNNWYKLSGATHYPVAATAGPTVIGWARINADGTIASCLNCTATYRGYPGFYEVDFAPLGDIRGVPRSATLDELGDGYEYGMISVGDVDGYNSRVSVLTLGSDGSTQYQSFVIVLYNY